MKKSKFNNNILIFQAIISLIAGFVYSFSVTGFFCKIAFNDIGNIAISSVFVFLAVSFFMFPFVFIAFIVEKFCRYISSVILVLAAFICVFMCYADGKIFFSIGVHIFDNVAIDTIKSGTLFQLMQANSTDFIEFLPATLMILFSLIIIYAIVYRKKTEQYVIQFLSCMIAAAVLFITSVIFIHYKNENIPESLKMYLPGYEIICKSSGNSNENTVVTNYKPVDKDFPALRNRKNILFIVVESLNMFTMDTEITPEISSFFRNGDVLTSLDHISSALYTEYSLFTLLYGVDNQYYVPFSRKKVASYPITLLRKNGYRTVGASASPLKRWRQHAKFLADKNFDLYTEFKGYESSDKDLLKFVKNDFESRDKTKPYLYFLFLNSTHYPYNFEKDFVKYKPYSSKDFSFLSKADDPDVKKAIKNRYMNAAVYMDHIFGAILDVFKNDIKEGNTAVIFTADHGEEFWESGKLGHGKYFHRTRYTVPMRMKLPGIGNKTVELSGHVSIFPTIIDYLMPEKIEPIETFMNGRSLLMEIPENKYFITGNDTFPFRDNRIMVTGHEGSIVVRKAGNYMIENPSFKIISEKALDEKDLPEKSSSVLQSYISDYFKSYMKYVVINHKK